MKKLVATSIFFLSCLISFAQQDGLYSQYMFNGLYLNPAYAGSHDYYSSTLLFRKQWVNFPGSPASASVAVDGPLYGKTMGIGLIGGVDKVGVTTQTDIYLNYSYQLKLGEGKLNFGVKGGISQYRAAISELVYWDQADQVYQGDIAGKVVPKFGFGFYYHQKEFYAGLSVPTTLAYETGNNFNIDLNKSGSLRRHYYLTGGYIFEANEEIKIKPTFLLKVLPSAPVQADINLSVLFRDMIWVGGSFRTGDAACAIIEYQANNRFRVGYAYDFTYSKLRFYSAGSHELMLGFDFGKDFNEKKAPRFF